jgi:hypothetical protein
VIKNRNKDYCDYKIALTRVQQAAFQLLKETNRVLLCCQFLLCTVEPSIPHSFVIQGVLIVELPRFIKDHLLTFTV